MSFNYLLFFAYAILSAHHYPLCCVSTTLYSIIHLSYYLPTNTLTLLYYVAILIYSYYITFACGNQIYLISVLILYVFYGITIRLQNQEPKNKGVKTKYHTHQAQMQQARWLDTGCDNSKENLTKEEQRSRGAEEITRRSCSEVM